MPITFQQLIAQVSPDTFERVVAAKDASLRILQDAMREDCRLLMRTPEETRRRKAGAQVPVEVVPGYPECLAYLEFPDDYWRVLLLSRFRSELEACIDGDMGLFALKAALIDKLETQEEASALADRLRDNAEWVRARLGEIRDVDPWKRVFGYNEDILGVYRYWPNDGMDDREPNRAKIELYWGVIGFVAQGRAFSVEDLTVVTLAHELAHAYTQVGADIQSRRWLASAFVEADVELKEGLAQYLCERVLKQIRNRYPKAIEVFEQLLLSQPTPYQIHKRWQEPLTPESLRAAMLEVRRNRLGRLDEFEQRLHRAADALS